VEGSESVPAFGFQYAVGVEPVSVNVERMVDKFRLGVHELRDIWREVLPGDVLEFLGDVCGMPEEQFRIPDEIWVAIIFSFAAAAHKKIINKEHLLKSLTPLYIGRTASFVMETWESGAQEVEDKIESLCVTFENKKSFLREAWNFVK